MCKLLKLQAAPEVDMELFDGNVLNYHHFMALFKEVIEIKVEDPRGRLIRLLKYTSGEAKELINHCIQLPSNEGFKYAKFLLEEVYGNPQKLIKQWPQIKFGDARAFRKFHTFLLKCRTMSFNQRWNASDSPDILCMLISKLPGEIMERWNRKVLNIRRCQVGEPTCKIATIKTEDENKKDVRGPSDDNSSKCKMCNGRNDLDECKTFIDMTVEEISKFLSKQKLCYGYYEVISPKHTARNCSRRRNCKICLAKHPTGLHGYKIRRKDDSKDGDDPGKTVKKNCANIKDVQCESIRTQEVLSMCVVPVKVRHKNTDKETRTFAILDT